MDGRSIINRLRPAGDKPQFAQQLTSDTGRTTQNLCMHKKWPMHILTKLCRRLPMAAVQLRTTSSNSNLTSTHHQKRPFASASFPHPAPCAPRTTDRPPCRADTPSQSPSRRSASSSARRRSRALPCGTFAHAPRDPRACERRVSTLLSGGRKRC